MDIWPEILKELKIVKNKFIINLLDKIVSYIYKKTDLILAQSISFKKMIKQKIKNSRVEYVPAWPETLFNNKFQIKKDKDDGLFLNNKKFKIVFTGNIGEAQNFENIMKAAELLKLEKNISWIIVGTGRKIIKFQEFIKNNNINNFFFIGKKPLDKISFYHNRADVLLISLCTGKALSGTIPGKLQTYLNSDKAILGFINGEVKRILQESGAGIYANPDNPSDLVEKIIYLKNNRDFSRNIETNKKGSKYIEKFFNRNTILSKIENLLNNQNYKNKFIKIISSTDKIPMNKNFSLSGLNLAFLGFYSKGVINIHKDLYHWPDGIFYKRFFGNKIQKIPGREIISNLKISSQIEKIYVFGDMSQNGYEFLLAKYEKKIIHIKLPHDSAKNLFNKYCNIEFKNTDIIILTLPTPKQEEFAEFIIKKNNFFKILCIGGALSMAAGDEKPIPMFFENYGLEFLWRLKSDRKRRIKRLIVSLLYFLKAELTLKFINQKTIFINNNDDEDH